MAAQVVVLLGPVRSGKTHALLRHFRATRKSAAPGNLEPALWLAPNGRTAAAVRDQILRDGQAACLRPGLMTFENFTDEVLIASHQRLKSLDSFQQRELVRHVVRQAAAQVKLQLFADAALRPGFIGFVVGHITELKRRRIGPDAYSRAVARGLVPPEHSELAGLYADYELLLAQRGLVDRQGTHQAACDSLAKNNCNRFQNLQLVVADGFTDFTATQHEILRLLSERTAQLFISLPAVADNSRPDLFAKIATTLRDLRQNYPQLEVRALDHRRLPDPLINHVAEHVFSNPKEIPAPTIEAGDPTGQIEIIAAASVQDEITQVARRIKSLLVASAPGTPPVARPNDILVAARSLNNLDSRVREVFERFGIPYFLEVRPAIATTLVMKILLDLLQLDQDDWPFRRVIALLTNNCLGAITESTRRFADWLIRDLQIASGRTALLERVQSLAEDATPPSECSPHHARRVEAAKHAQSALALLADAIHELPQQATPTQWCEALGQLGTTLGLAPFVADHENVTSTADSDAWRTAQAALADVERLGNWLQLPQRSLGRAELLSTLCDISTNTTLPLPYNETGRVRVLAATSARNISTEYLFLIGMSEQAFPSPEQSGRFASDADYRQIAFAHQKKTRDTTPPATAAQAEMLLFYEIISRAEKVLTISYPALDDKAQSLPPSPYVVELERLFAHAHGQYIHHTTPQLSPVESRPTEPRQTSVSASAAIHSVKKPETKDHTAGGPYSIADWRTRAVAEAISSDRDCRLLAGIFADPEVKPLADSMDAGLRIVHSRARGETFGPFEGLLQSAAVAAKLAKQFGPQHTWSASQWETYATCPFRFYMQHVLGLEPLGDLVLETDYSRRGSRLHDVLATFHRRWLTVRKSHYATDEEEEAAFLDYLLQVVDERTSLRNQAGVDAALAELDRRQIRKWAKKHFTHKKKYDEACERLSADMTPAYFEFRFGPKRRGGSDSDPDSTASMFVLDVAGERVRVTGQIDRIDIGELDGRQVFNVIDYKSSRPRGPKPNEPATGQQLQLPIYVEAAQALLFNNKAAPLQAGYWNMEKGFDSKGALVDRNSTEGDFWSETRDTTRQLIRTFIDQIRHGDFPVDSLDDDCTSTCDYRLICRIGQIRSLGKTRHLKPGTPATPPEPEETLHGDTQGTEKNKKYKRRKQL